MFQFDEYLVARQILIAISITGTKTKVAKSVKVNCPLKWQLLNQNVHIDVYVHTRKCAFVNTYKMAAELYSLFEGSN